MVRKKWKCGCGKKYKRRQGLYEHIRLKHHCPRHVPDMANAAFVPVMSNLLEVVVDRQLFNLIRC